MPAASLWTNPAGLYLLLLLAPLVALYVLRARRTRTIVASVWLFREARRDLTAARKLRRLVPATPLFIEALAVLALAFAAAGPSRRGSLGAGDAVAIVVDASESMGALDGGESRLERAKEAAKRLIRGSPGRNVLVVEAAKEPRAATGIEHDPDRLADVVDAIAPRAEGADLGAAILLAEERLAALPGRHRVAVVTDVNGSVPERTRSAVEVVRVGAPADNVAVTRLELRRTSDTSGRDRVDALVVVQSFGESATTRFVALSRRGAREPFASRRVALAPRERATVTLSFDVTDDATGAGVDAELSPSDALAADDAAFATVPPGPRLPVVVAGADDPWLVRALEADDGVELRRAPIPLPAGAVPRGALLVTIGACAASNGDVLVVAPPAGDCLGVHVGDEIEPRAVTSWSERDARLRFVSFDDVHVPTARRLDASRAASLVRAGDASVVADLGLPGRVGTLVGFDWQKSDWPLRASFVLFVRNVTELARADRARAFAGSARTGEMLRVAAPTEGSTFAVRGPRGELTARATFGTLLAAPPPVPGFYDVLADGHHVQTVAVNVEDFRESDLRSLPDSRVPGAAEGEARAQAGAPSPLAPYLAALALAACLAEAWWLSRRASPRTGAIARRSGVFAACLAVGSALAVYALAVVPHLRNAPLTFERPAWLLLGVAVLAGSFLFSGSGRRARGVEAALAAATLAAALAGAGAALRLGFDRLAVIVAVDRSRSVDLVPDASTKVDASIAAASKNMKARDQLAVVAFASEAALEEPLRGAAEPRSPQRAALSRDGTDLSAAIRRALSETPPDSAARIVLVTDGVATRGDTMAGAAAAALAGVPVDVLPLMQAPRPNVRVESLRAPARASEGESMDLRVVVRSSADTSGTLHLLLDGEELERSRVALHAGEDALFVRAHAPAAGLHRYAVQIVPDDAAADAVAEDDAETAFVRVVGRARAVVIEDDAGHAGPIRSALESAAFDVDVTTATRAPEDASELLSSDLVVLGDVPARDFSGDQLDQLGSYVEHLGGGVLLLGGKRAMGPGGYTETPVEKISPVSFELKNERRRARLAEVIAIDYSGSMAVTAGNHTKLELANEAAVRSAELLGAIDRLGVLHVDTTATWTVPLGPIADKAAIGRAVRAVGTGGGGIYVDRALETAYAALDREQVEQKHVLLFADGDDAEERSQAPALARAARARNITTSVVALGRGQDTGGLERLSREGEGRFYLVEDATRLPAVFAEETTIAAGSAFHEELFRPRPGISIPGTRGVDFSQAPALGGYVVTTAKPRAEVALFAPDGDPLLATWSAGSGHAGAFTSDYSEPWGTAFRAWPGAARLFGQLGRSLARGADDPTITVDAAVSAGALRIGASALGDDGGFDSHRSLTATVVGPDGFVRSARLEGTSPGSYEALVPLAHAGTYVAEVRDDVSGTSAGSAGAVLSASDELEPTGTDRALLERIAKLTGGKMRGTLDGVFADRPDSRRGFRSLSALLSALGAFFMLLSAALRRIPSLGLRLRFASASPRTEATTAPARPNEPPSPPAPPDTAQTEPASRDGAVVVEPVSAPEPSATAEAGAPNPPPTTAELLLSRRRRRNDR
ncbi:MAG TPA: VWA domain-containing protein [Polyangiaceae bacterium]|nr:VWA domain-containing protein [Polyangiaceae bacterium]